VYIRYLGCRELWFRPYGGSLFPTAEKVTKKAVLLVGFLLRRNTLTPVSLRGPAPNGHPCPDGALAASMRLGPLRETCVQPAPKSRLAVIGPFAYEDQKQIRSRSEADQKQIRSRSEADQKQIRSRSRASRLKPVLQGSQPVPLAGCDAFSGTGFSREGVGVGAGVFGLSPCGEMPIQLQLRPMLL
jgi:hypothetical protein